MCVAPAPAPPDVFRPLALPPAPRPPSRRPAAAAIVVLHVAVGWGLLQLRPAMLPRVTVAPVFVRLLALPTTVPAAVRPPAGLRPAREPGPGPLHPTGEVAPAPPAPETPAEAAPAAVAAAAAPTPATAASVPATVAAVAPDPAPPPPAQPIPPSAIQYLVPPDIVYPRASRRLGETGLVVVAVRIDAEGVPREAQVVQSSGFERLDRAAVAGVLRARFRPLTVDGRPLAGWARIPVPFQLDAGP